MRIDPTGQVPIYRQIRDRIVEGIAAGLLPPGTTLSPVRKLAAEFRINPSTVVKAYDLLRHEGFIQTSRNAGTFVSERKPPDHEFMKEWTQQALTLFSEAKARGISDEDVMDLAVKLLATIKERSTEPQP